MLSRPARWLVTASATAVALLSMAAPAQAVSLPGETQIPPTQAATPPQQTRSAAFTVSVVRGDTLWALAARWCANPYRYPVLAAANGITDPDVIQVGQRITVTCTTTTMVTSTTRQVATTSRPVPGPQGWLAPLAGTLWVRGDCRVGGSGGHWLAQRTGHLHQGIDLSRPSGTPVRAVHAGTVRTARWGTGAGWYVLVDHGTYQSVYMHLVRRPPVTVGTRVSVGRVVGYVGSTGHSTGPHLHFEIHHGAWHPVNPAPFLRNHGVPVRGC